MRTKCSLAAATAAAVAITIVITSSGVAYANTNDIATTNETISALSKVDAWNDSLVSAATPSTTDVDSIAQTAVVDVPTNPSKGVTLQSPSLALTISLPNTTSSGYSKKTSDGMVVYSDQNGSANTVIPTDAGVQFLTTIKNKKAPTEYAYSFSLAMGSKIEVSPDGGSAAVINADGDLVAFVPSLYAKDANGNDISTRFTTDGETLTQVVKHRSNGVAYPVVADPIVIWLMGVTAYRVIAGSYEAKNLVGQPWWVWVWGLALACVQI